MTAPVSLLARRWELDVSTDNTTWVKVKHISDFKPNVDPTMQDDSTYDSNGWSSSTKTFQEFGATATFFRKTVSGVADPGQEILRAAEDQFGSASQVYYRYYATDGGPEAYTGAATVKWELANTGIRDLASVTVTLMGQGARTKITNPFSTTAAPVVVSVSPSAAGTGALITITGQYFTGVTGAAGVKVGATNATNYTVLSDSTIVATVPSGSAGATTVTVTHPTNGASNALAYTRAA